MSLDFVAIDFETANSNRGSPCSVGLVAVEAGALTDSRYELMRPPANYDDFDYFNIDIHGIEPAMVADKPRFGEIWGDIERWIDGRPLVAHNAGFDIGVMTRACTYSDLPWPTLAYFCTMVLGRCTYDLPSYTLDWLADAAGIAPFEHHHAEQDAFAAANIMLAICAVHGVDNFEDLVVATRTRPGRLAPGFRKGNVKRALGGKSSLSMPDTNLQADPEHPLFGQNIAFTGDLGFMRRQDAFDACAHLGATPQKTLRKDTTILVVGSVESGVLRPGEQYSKKLRDAFDRCAEGAGLEIMSAFDFGGMLD